MSDHTPVARAYGPVPQEFGQTSQSAEWLGLLAATDKCQESQTNLPIISDCKAVISSINGEKSTLGNQIVRGAMHTDFLKVAFANELARKGGRPTMKKVKAHQRWDDLESDEQRKTFVGNDLADEAAKLGAALHPKPSRAEVACADADWHLHKEITRAVGKILQVFPTFRAGQGRHRLKKTAEHEAEKKHRSEERELEANFRADHSFSPACPHSFFKSRQGDFYFCCHCFARATSQQSAAERQRSQECEGKHPTLQRATEAGPQLGHTLLVAVQDEQPTVICVRCGAMASSHRFTGLFQPCTGRASARGSEGIRRVQNRLHPDPRKPGRLDLVCRVVGDSLEQVA